ncbi:unnamed protein product, partial [Ectocarpus sp. 12 AP-2014]
LSTVSCTQRSVVRDGNNTDTLCRQLDTTSFNLSRTLVRHSNKISPRRGLCQVTPFRPTRPTTPNRSCDFVLVLYHPRTKNTNKGTQAPSAYAVFLVIGIILNHSAVDLFDPLFFYYLHRVTELNAHPPPQHARNVSHATEPV